MGFIVNYDLKIFQTLNELSIQFAEILKNEVSLAKNNFNLVLSGGSTPKYIFNYLSANHKTTIEWNKIKFFFGDERCVPPDNNESNYKMAYESLLSKLSIPEENIFRIKGEYKPDDEAKHYSDLITSKVILKNGLPQFDLIMLGLGEDGHTASIFPDQMNLLNENKICSVATHPKTKQQRITLTGGTINNACNIVFIVTGKNKSKIVDDLLNHKQDSINYPANFINPLNGKLFWLLDEEAASLLKGN